MKPKKEYVVLILIIAALSAYLVFHKESRLHYRMPVLGKISKKEITRLTLKDASSDITLQKEDGKWLILPEKYHADSSLIDGMEQKITSLTLTALASKAGYNSVYGLGNSGAISVTAYDGKKVLRSFDVGKPASEGRQTFITIGGDDRIFYADGDLRHSFARKVEDLRDKTVLSFNDGITGMTVGKGSRKSVFVKTTSGAKGKNGKKSTVATWLTAEGSKADPGKIDDIISTLSSLNCDGFVPSKTKKDFTHPSYVVTLKGEKTYSLSLFRKEGDKYPAVSSQSDYPFYLEGWKAEALMKNLDALSAKAKEAGRLKGKKI